MNLQRIVSIVLCLHLLVYPAAFRAVAAQVAPPAPQNAFTPAPSQPTVPRLPPDNILELLQHQQEIFESLFPGASYQWVQFPYLLDGVVAMPGSYPGTTPHGPFTLVVDEAFPVDIAALPPAVISAQLKAEAMAHGFQCATILGALETGAAKVSVIGVAVSHTTIGLQSKFLLIDYLPATPVIPLAAGATAAASAGCSINPSDYDCPPVRDDLCGPPCDPELGGMQKDQDCIDDACEKYKAAMVNACVAYTQAVNNADAARAAGLVACSAVLAGALIGCAAASWLGWLTGGTSQVICVALAAAVFAACLAVVLVNHALALKAAKENYDLATEAAANIFNSAIANCCVPCPH